MQDGHRNGTIALADREFESLGPDCVFAHSVDLTASDMDLVVRHDVKIVHNPSSVMSIRGCCPAPELIDRGVTVALGSDAPAPDRSYDMFRHMAQCMHYHRRPFRNPAVLPVGKVLEMATIDGAHALGMADRIGSLESGKHADIIAVDLFKPHLVPLDMPAFRLAHFANAADVDTVIVPGKLLMEERRADADERGILEAAENHAKSALSRSGLQYLRATPPSVFRRSGLSRPIAGE